MPAQRGDEPHGGAGALALVDGQLVAEAGRELGLQPVVLRERRERGRAARARPAFEHDDAGATLLGGDDRDLLHPDDLRRLGQRVAELLVAALAFDRGDRALDGPRDVVVALRLALRVAVAFSRCASSCSISSRLEAVARGGAAERVVVV